MALYSTGKLIRQSFCRERFNMHERHFGALRPAGLFGARAQLVRERRDDAGAEAFVDARCVNWSADAVVGDAERPRRFP